MPTALSFYQFSAAICIDGRPLDIWNPTFDQETGVAEAWIASEAGKEYSIHWKRDFDIGCDVSGKVQLDGSTQTSASIVPPRRFFGWNELRGARASAYSEKPFAFAEIRTTDDEKVVTTAGLPPKPGQIALEIYRIAITGTFDGAQRPAQREASQKVESQVHEKTKKVGCHMTSLNPERPSRKWSFAQVTPLTCYDCLPYLTFVFKYRPAAILRAAGIIPPGVVQYVPETNAAKKEEQEEEDDDDDVDKAEAEIAALQSALKARVELLAKRKRVNAEDLESEISRKKRQRTVKTEEDQGEAQVKRPTEVIDLTSL